MLDECGRRFWRSRDGDEVVTPTSRAGWLTHARAEYCDAGDDANATATREGGARATRDIERGETIVVDAGAGTRGGWVGAAATRATADARGDDLLRWLADAPPTALRARADGALGVFALEDVKEGRVMDLSVARAEEVVRGRARVGEDAHGTLAKAFRRRGRAGEDALERLRRRYPFSNTHQTFPMRGGLDAFTTLSAINHADAPNLKREANETRGARFVATRDIEAGEEFTIDRRRECTLEVPGTGGFLAHYEWTVEGKEPPWERAGAGARARGGIDYSKWDDVASSSSDDWD